MFFIWLITILGLFTSTVNYNLLERIYSNNVIDIHISACPVDINCILMLFEANAVLQVPGSFIHVNWYFDAVETTNIKTNNLNEIIFKYQPDYKSQTEFQVQNGIVLEFNMFISIYNLTPEHLYNVILHELGHVYLLAHSEYKDSIMGYKLGILPNGYPKKEEKLYLSNDDCIGLYKILINNIQTKDYIYSIYLEQMRDNYCGRLYKNYILEDPSLIIQSKLKKNNFLEIQSPHQKLIQSQRQSQMQINDITKPFNTRYILPKSRRIIKLDSASENNYDKSINRISPERSR